VSSGRPPRRRPRGPAGDPLRRRRCPFGPLRGPGPAPGGGLEGGRYLMFQTFQALVESEGPSRAASNCGPPSGVGPRLTSAPASLRERASDPTTGLAVGCETLPRGRRSGDDRDRARKYTRPRLRVVCPWVLRRCGCHCGAGPARPPRPDNRSARFTPPGLRGGGGKGPPNQSI